MSINLKSPSGQSIAELHDVKILGLPGIGGYTLIVRLDFSSPSVQADTHIRNVSARLEWGDASQRLIGHAGPDGMQPIQLNAGTSTLFLDFRFFVSPPQIEAIESRRNGGDFALRICFYCEVSQNGNSRGVFDAHVFKVRQQDWIDALSSMEYGNTLLFEMPMPDIASTVGPLLKRARGFLYQGHYDQAVALCRQTIETIEQVREDRSLAKNAVNRFKEARLQMNAQERMLFLREALKNTTHLAVHTSCASGYSRDEALSILGMTVSLLKYFDLDADTGPLPSTASS